MTPPSSSPPNILFVFTDMQRADTIRALGNDVIRTPHLDRLVREGTSFTNCFSPCPVCVPARCSMHYGMYPQRTGLFDNGRMMDDNGASYPAVLGQHGYRTHAIGKCHFTPDHLALRGFQSRQTQEEVHSDPKTDDYIAWLRDQGYDDYEPHGARGDMYYLPQISSLPAKAHPSQWISDQSRRFLRDPERSTQPWCLFSSFIHPHPPFTPPKPWHKLYRTPDMPLPFLPDNRTDFHTWINRHQNRYKYRDRGLDLNLVRTIKAYYYATISFVDYQIGRILETLEATNQLENTLIVFSSDHGEFLGDFGCFGKRSMHDASSRVPLIVRYPKTFPANQRSTTATTLCDLFPTFLAAAGISAEGLQLDGQDLAETALSPNPERLVFSQFSEKSSGIYMAVNAHWKYVYSATDQAEYFFNRQQDPQESVNLAHASEVTEIKNQIKQALLHDLEASGAEEVHREAAAGTLTWRNYPPKDESYLRNPDADLLVQDYPSYPLDLPGYSDCGSV